MCENRRLLCSVQTKVLYSLHEKRLDSLILIELSNFSVVGAARTYIIRNSFRSCTASQPKLTLHEQSISLYSASLPYPEKRTAYYVDSK